MKQLFTTMTRRGWLGMTGAVSVATARGWLGQLAAASESIDRPKRSCLLLWMNGGPSQTDTFDMKPGRENGGPFRTISTNVPGITISEHLPEISKWMHRLSIVRSMSTREGDHGRARDHLRTGYLPQASIQFPVLGSLVSHEWGPQSSDLPNYVSILPNGLFNAGAPAYGYLGADYAPLIVGGDANAQMTRLKVDNLALANGVSTTQAYRRLELLSKMERDFLDRRPGNASAGHRGAYSRSVRLMSPLASEAFDLSRESKQTLEKYGETTFGQGCLLARRLLERNVPFVEVNLGGWDTHNENFPAVERLSRTLDRAWGALMADLEAQGLLDSTVIVWMGEFGRTPIINPQAGRDHYPKAWSVVVGGGGIRGGEIIGDTGPDGIEVEDRPVTIPDLLATICRAIGIDPMKQNMSNVARPIRVVDPEASPILEILA